MAKEDQNAKILKNRSGTMIDILDLTDERLDMPNLNRVVDKEVERLQRELIEDMKEVILADIKFDSIDYIPERDVIIDDPEINYFKAEFNRIIELVNTSLRMGNAENPDQINMEKYLELFKVEYNVDGIPRITLVISIDSVDGEDLSINADKINITKNGKGRANV